MSVIMMVWSKQTLTSDAEVLHLGSYVCFNYSHKTLAQCIHQKTFYASIIRQGVFFCVSIPKSTGPGGNALSCAYIPENACVYRALHELQLLKRQRPHPTVAEATPTEPKSAYYA